MLPIAVKWSALGCLVACLSLTGCASFGGGGGFLSKQHEPKIEEEPDRWAIAGKEGRGNRPLEDEHDPFKPFLMSKQARDIERNLGYQ
jgi:hypothetical protein